MPGLGWGMGAGWLWVPKSLQFSTVLVRQALRAWLARIPWTPEVSLAGQEPGTKGSLERDRIYAVPGKGTWWPHWPCGGGGALARGLAWTDQCLSIQGNVRPTFPERLQGAWAASGPAEC